MKKYLIVLLAISFFLASCATETTKANPAPTVTVTAYADVEDSTKENSYNDDDIYLEIIRQSSPYADLFTDKDLFDMGKNFCKQLKSGITVEEFISDSVDEFYDDDDALDLIATIAGVAIAHYCPEFGYQFD
jgi:thioredoxin-related protein